MKRKDDDIHEAILDEPAPLVRRGPIDESADHKEARKLAVAGARTDLVPQGEPALFGSKAFYARAAEELFESTSAGLELAGCVLAKRTAGRTQLVGLKREGCGQPGRVAIDPRWGGMLWHTHPGLKGSLAAFSNEDLTAAKQAGRPLLVIGFGGLSPDVITTLTLPIGVKGLLLSAGLKGLMALEKSGSLQRRLLNLGVAARICYPSGRIQPVLRASATPLQAALDDMSFAIDRGVGAVERVGQKALKDLIGALLPRR